MATVQIDFRVEAWERVELDSETHAEIIEAVKSGEITTTNGIIEWDNELDWEVLSESEEYPDPQPGICSIEIWKEDNVIWDNRLPDFDKEAEIEKSLKYLLNDWEIREDVQNDIVKRFLQHLDIINTGKKVV